ncbi:N-acetylmannosamine-6-phosphate 2-epimerase [Amycolatopsis sp. GM8]|uniref:N-acetylmannosamine-6-phosphate 2-epimerase n=1 Tax=Amycolatopsis sp. GM8 TaxID=2896530 RepID=UPI001F1CB9E0|nr:N-acetylmannosamine-6-phosphate 2-epimerase [Amycolatopsis sp. GM8]
MEEAHQQLLNSLQGGLVVSCQSNPGEAFHSSAAMAMFARTALASGAVGIRAQGPDDVALIHQDIPLPQIGLWKTHPAHGVFITPTLEHALAVARAGAEIIAIDGTRRPRPDGLTLRETITAIHERTNALVMADVATAADATAAQDAGSDMVSTTLSGYTDDTRDKGDGPDFDLLRTTVAALTVPVFAEGRIRTPELAAEAIALGAHAVVVGTAITDPTTITSWFVQAIHKRQGLDMALRTDSVTTW